MGLKLIDKEDVQRSAPMRGLNSVKLVEPSDRGAVASNHLLRLDKHGWLITFRAASLEAPCDGQPYRGVVDLKGAEQEASGSSVQADWPFNIRPLFTPALLLHASS